MRIVTSVTTWNDAVGKRMSITYSEIDEETGTIIADNKRIDRIVVKPADVEVMNQLATIAQNYVDSIE